MFFLFEAKNLFIAIVTKPFFNEEEGKKKQFLSLILICFWYYINSGKAGSGNIWENPESSPKKFKYNERMNVVKVVFSNQERMRSSNFKR